MSFRNIFFVGFFLNREDKQEFTELFKCKSKFFLESSLGFIHSNTKKVDYFPTHIIAVMGSRAINLLFNTVKKDQFFIDLYKRDLRVYLNSYINYPLPLSIKAFLLYLYWVFRREFKHRVFYSPVGFFTAIWKIIRKEGASPGMSFRDIKALKLLAFRLSFFSGYIYIERLFSNLKLDKEDLFVLWGAHNSSHILLIKKLKEKNINYLITEYGETPGTFSLNKKGIFGDSYIADNWSNICSTKLSIEEYRAAEKYINQLVSKENSSIDESVKISRGIKKVIYVSGVELIASGHLFSKKYIGKNGLNANKILLNSVLDIFDNNDYIILYKDHPLMQKNHEKLTLNPADYPGVMFFNSSSVDNLINMSDITITLPSKVAMTCMLYRKPVYVFGMFSIPENVPKLGYYTGYNITDVKAVLNNTEIDESMYIKIIGVLLGKYLVRVNNALFDKYSYENEQRKLENIIYSQIPH